MRSQTSSGSSGTSSGLDAEVLGHQLAAQPQGERVTRRRAPSRSVTRTSCTAQAISESLDHERRLKLSDPTLAHTSSMTQTLACT